MNTPATDDSGSVRPVGILKSRRFPLSATEATDGGTLNALRLVETLLDEGISVQVFTGREAGQPTCEKRGQLTVYRVEWKSSSADHVMLRDYEEGASFVNSVLSHPAFWPYRYRALHVHHWTSAVGLSEHIPPRVRLIYTPHLLAREKGRSTGIGCPKPVQESEREILDRADTVVALSDAEASSIRSLSGSLTPVLAPNGIDSAFFDLPRKPLDPSQGVHLLSVARLAAQKGLIDLVDAFESVLERGWNATLTIVGGSYQDPDYESRLRRCARSSPLRKRVRLIGAVPHPEIVEWMRRSDVYLQSSHYESQCVALLEAMASGLPVIASRLDAVCEYVDDEQNGLMFTSGNVNELASKIEMLFRFPRLSDSLSQNARESARRFEWMETQEDLLQRIRTPANTTPTGEKHNSSLATRLRDHASKRAHELAQHSRVQAVILTGSLVNGPVRRGSDVDLYIVKDDEQEEQDGRLVPPWRFVSDEIIENVHTLPASWLEQGVAMLGDNSDLADWFYQNPACDHFIRSEPLVWNEDRLSRECFRDLVAARRRPEIQRRVALRYVSEADPLIDAARSLLADGKTEDAHQTLRASSQHTLVASIIRLGWTLRGAKKRPEIASSFLPDEGVRSALGLVLDVVGLHGLSREKAARYCDVRMEMRSMLVAELQRLASKFKSARGLLSRVREHERNAVDYYNSMVRSYKIRGPVNHIRCLSGFPTIPARLLSSLDVTSVSPINDFLSSQLLSAEIKETWADLAALESEPDRINSWLSKAEEVNKCLKETCGG